MKKGHFVQVLDLLQLKAGEGTHITIEEFFHIMGSEGHAILMVFLCLPYLQPIPIPGLSVPFGLLVCVVAVFLYTEKPPYLPERFKHIKISSELTIKISEMAERIWLRIHKRIYERWTFCFQSPSLRLLSLMIVLANGLLLSLPLPIPFSNTVPAIAIILNSLGQMEKDGLFVILSYFWCLVSFGFFIGLSMGTVWGFHQI